MAFLYLRDIPEGMVRKLKAAAALHGQTLTDYAIEVFENALKKEPIGDVANVPRQKRPAR